MAGEGGVAAVHRALHLDAFTETDQKLGLAELAKRTGTIRARFSVLPSRWRNLVI